MKLRNMIIAAMAATGAIAGQAENLPESDSYGIVTGRITDSESHTLPGATIQIENLHTGVTSDINGFYTLSNLKPGKYVITVQL